MPRHVTDLDIFLAEIGLAPARQTPPPLDPDALRAVREGITPQWKPAYPGEEPPF